MQQRTDIPGLAGNETAYTLDDGVTIGVVALYKGTSTDGAYLILAADARTVDADGTDAGIAIQRVTHSVPFAVLQSGQTDTQTEVDNLKARTCAELQTLVTQAKSIASIEAAPL